MLQNEKKMIAAAAASLVVVAGLAIAVLQMNQDPKQIVDEADSGASHSLLAMEETSDVPEAPVSESSLELPGVAVGTGTEDPRGEGMSLPEHSDRDVPSQEQTSKRGTTLVVKTNEKGETTVVEAPVEQSASTPKKATSKGTEAPASKKEAPSSERDPEMDPKAETDASKLEETHASQEESDDPVPVVTVPPEGTTPSASQSQQPEEPEEPEASETAPEAGSSEAASTEEKAKRVDTEVAKKLNDADPYEKQAMGAAAVTYYAHPSLTLGLDLRRDAEAARNLFVLSQPDGFVIMPRMALALTGTAADEVKGLVNEGKALPGTVRVKRMAPKERDALQAKDPEAVFVDDGGDVFYAIYREKGKNPDAALEKATPAIDLNLIARNLSTSGLIGKPSAPSKVTLEEQDQTWQEMVKAFEQDPAQAEQKYGLPLLASSSDYEVDGKDVRANVPQGVPNYSFGQQDVNGDGTDDYVLRVDTEGSKTGTASGYYAIYTPTPQGLMQASFVPAGSGEIIAGDEGLIFTAQDRSDQATSVVIYEDALGDNKPARVAQKLTFTKVAGESGKALAEKYPDDSLVLLEDGIYRFSMKAFDELMDYAAHQMEGHDFFSFTGKETNDAGEEVPGTMHREALKDAADLIQQSSPHLPLSVERLQKAASTQRFKDVNRALTTGDFDRVE
ncbi:MAG: hypothetical protein PUJ57_06450 [Peptoniphilaceae bacterium]|nr:hypothetical protein [Peptoniphilaceae bacterium]MDY6085322.1 hypothetical protein [Peptoniphilaceae bacterium]